VYTFPQTTSIVFVNTVYLAMNSVELFIFQSEVKYFQELLVCLLICFVHFISVFDSCLISCLSFNNFYKDFVAIWEMCHLNITAIHIHES
jgi:hypothetical protein